MFAPNTVSLIVLCYVLLPLQWHTRTKHSKDERSRLMRAEKHYGVRSLGLFWARCLATRHIKQMSTATTHTLVKRAMMKWQSSCRLRKARSSFTDKVCSYSTVSTLVIDTR